MEEQVKEKKNSNKVILMILGIIILITVICVTIFMLNKKEEEEIKDDIIRVSTVELLNLLESKQRMQVFILAEATEEEVKEIGEKLNQIEGVKAPVEFVSREDAYNEMKNKLEDRKEVMDGIEPAVFSPSYIIRVTDFDSATSIEEQINEIENVKRVTTNFYEMPRLKGIPNNELEISKTELQKRLEADELTMKDFTSMSEIEKAQYLIYGMWAKRGLEERH